MIFTSDFFDKVLPLLKPIGEEQYKIIKEKLTEQEKKELIDFDKMIKISYGEDKGIVNIDKIK